MPAESDRPSGLSTGLARSILQEIAAALARLDASGAESAIDLRSLPMTPDDRDELAAHLGEGEVSASLNVSGASEIRETRYAGVWWVRHFGADDALAAERIEIARVPEILMAQAADVTHACSRLRLDLAADAPPPSLEVPSDA